MKGCQSCFDQLTAIIKASIKTDETEVATMSMAARARWMLNKSKIKTLKSDLGQQKITLTLMIEILGCASRRSSR